MKVSEFFRPPIARDTRTGVIATDSMMGGCGVGVMVAVVVSVATTLRCGRAGVGGLWIASRREYRLRGDAGGGGLED
jgi:hypothetical protein